MLVWKTHDGYKDTTTTNNNNNENWSKRNTRVGLTRWERWSTGRNERCTSNLKMYKRDAQGVMKYLLKKGMITKEIHKDVVQILAENFPSDASKEVGYGIQLGKECTDDNPKSGCPKTSTTNEQVDAIHHMGLDDRHLTVQYIAKSIDISSGLVHTILTEVLEMSKVFVRWVLSMLTVMLELWGMQSIPLLLLLPGPLWPRAVAPDRVLSTGQIQLNCTFAKLNCLK